MSRKKDKQDFVDVSLQRLDKYPKKIREKLSTITAMATQSQKGKQ